MKLIWKGTISKWLQPGIQHRHMHGSGPNGATGHQFQGEYPAHSK